MRNSITSIFIVLTGLTISNIQAQHSYTTSKGDRHLLGLINLSDLNSPDYYDWYLEGINSYDSNLEVSIQDKLEDVQVKIFLGTWCGDTKSLLPKFIKLWEQAGLNKDKLELIGLHNQGNEYKRSPNRIEDDYNIHRVPTFIFEKEGKEIGRIVERPLNDLETDISQIALGFSSEPRYKAASMLYEYFENHEADSLLANISEIIRPVYRNVSTSSELNTLGYVLKAKEKYEEAEFVFVLNTRLFRYNPNVFDSLGEFYLDTNRFEESMQCFEQVLAIDEKNERAKSMITELKEKVQE